MTEARAPGFNFWTLTGGKSLLEGPRFRRLWEQHVLGQMGQYALSYALLILVVGNSGSGIRTGLFILAFTIPSATLGPISGVVVDHLSRGFVLAATGGIRTLLCVGLLVSAKSDAVIYLFALAFAALSQFNSPAVAAALPQVVKQEELTSANSLLNLGALFAEAVGIVLLGALMLRTVGADPLLVVIAGLFAASAFLAATITGSTERATGTQLQRAMKAGIRAQFARAWQTLRRDSPSYLALIVNVVGNASLLVGITVLPRFAKEQLGVSADSVVFVFAPGAIGIFLGLRGANRLSNLMGKGRAQAFGFIVLVLSMLSFGLVASEAGLLTHWNPLGIADPGPLHGRGARIAITMVTVVFAGFGSSLVNVASRAIINERIPLEMQGRVFAAQNVLGNVASVAPLLVAGVLADLAGVRPVLVGLAVLMSLFVGWAALRARSMPALGGLHA
ncbi:MAG TPA: MFS transporter [Dehalococcoidia bacterium]|nr:MFS transporter [Dehalococcoidia bacterium]